MAQKTVCDIIHNVPGIVCCDRDCHVGPQIEVKKMWTHSEMDLGLSEQEKYAQHTFFNIETRSERTRGRPVPYIGCGRIRLREAAKKSICKIFD